MPKKRKKNRLFTGTTKKTGMPPGTPVYVGDQAGQPIQITLIDYNEQSLNEQKLTRIEDSFGLQKTPTVTWINIDGVHDVEMIEKVGRQFNLHPLTLEDIAHPGQRPKFEEYDQYLFIVVRMLQYSAEAATVNSEQVSFIVGDNFLVTFQETVGDVFEQIRQRIRNDKGRVRKMGCDFLAYALIDAIVDHYFSILELMGEKIETFEEQILSSPGESTLSAIHDMKRELLMLRKSVWPLRELLGAMQRTDSTMIKQGTRIYLRDVYDHTVQILDIIESFRDAVSGILDIYLSSLNNKMNATMKVLTIITTIFIPLSFITGVYGMNVKHFPELEWRWFYPIGFWGIIVVLVFVMLLVFRKNKWL